MSTSSAAEPSQAARRIWLFTLGACLTALFVAPLFGHADDSDQHLYRVVVRNMVQADTWLDLQYVPGIHASFREHLPFGFWPYALSERVLGERSLPGVSLVFTVLTLVLVFRVASRLGGFFAGWLAVLSLGATEAFFVYGLRTRLDPLLVLLSTLSATPILLGRSGTGAFLFSATSGALAALVKGPFGLVALAATSTAQLLQRRRRVFLSGALACGLAALPLCVFLLLDRHTPEASWWKGYVEAQLLASATGQRADGATSLFFPFQTIASRFWPGLLILLVGAAHTLIRVKRKGATLEPAVRSVALSAVILLALLCIPGRKVWNHALIAYPLLSIWAGLMAAPLLSQLLRDNERQARTLLGLRLLAVVLWIAAVAGLGAPLAGSHAVSCRDFAPLLRSQAPGSPVLVVAGSPWKESAALASELRLSPHPLRSIDSLPREAPPMRGDEVRRARFAVVHSGQAFTANASWREVQRSRGWILLERLAVPPSKR